MPIIRPDDDDGSTTVVPMSSATLGDASTDASSGGAEPMRDTGEETTGYELPEGCGDGIVTPGQYCFVPIPMPELPPPEHFEVGQAVGFDVDGDGRDELVVNHGGWGYLPVWLHDRDVLVAGDVEQGVDHHDLPRGSPWDWDGDGRMDLIVPWQNTEARVSVIRSLGDRLAPAEEVRVAEAYLTGQSPIPIDADGDGQLEFIVAAELPATEIGAHLRKRVDGEWVDVGPTLPMPGCVGISHWAYGDFDEDGHTDAVSFAGSTWCEPYPTEYDPEYHRVTVFLSNPATGEIEIGGTAPMGQMANSDVVVDDFDGDGHDDLVLQGGGGIRLLRGSGDGTLLDPEFVTEIDGIGENWSVGAYADFDGDGDREFLGGSSDEAGVWTSWILEEIAGMPRLASIGLPDGWGSAIALADLNADGVADFVGNTPLPSSEKFLALSQP